MLVDVSSFRNPIDNLCHFSKIHLPVNCFDRLRIRRLHADLELYESRPQRIQKFQLFFRNQIGSNFKMEICHTIIMFCDEFPDRHCVIFFAVEGTIYKFNLRYLLLQKEGKLLFYEIEISEPEPFINGRKAVAARERTATARLIINDAVLKFFQVCIGKIHLGQIHNRTPRVAFDCTVCITVCNAMDLLQRFPLHPIPLVLIINCYFPESHFSLAFHNSGKERILFQHLLCMVRNLRPAKPDLCFRTDFMIFCNQILYD